MKTTKAKKQDSLEDIGRRAYDGIVESVEMLDAKGEDGESDERAQEKARESIAEEALSVEIRSGWVSPGDTMIGDEFKILLGTGGPAVRIVGELNSHGEPMSATLETQDWGTPWTEYRDADESVLLTYCQQFYFGEG